MKHATEMETCTKIYFLFIFNLVEIKIRKTSLFWLDNLMTSQWKPSIQQAGLSLHVLLSFKCAKERLAAVIQKEKSNYSLYKLSTQCSHLATK